MCHIVYILLYIHQLSGWCCHNKRSDRVLIWYWSMPFDLQLHVLYAVQIAVICGWTCVCCKRFDWPYIIWKVWLIYSISYPFFTMSLLIVIFKSARSCFSLMHFISTAITNNGKVPDKSTPLSASLWTQRSILLIALLISWIGSSWMVTDSSTVVYMPSPLVDFILLVTF